MLSYGGSGTPALPGGTRSIPALKASEGCGEEAGRGPGDALRKSDVQRHSEQTAALKVPSAPKYFHTRVLHV